MNVYRKLGLILLLTIFSISLTFAGELDNASGYYSMDNGLFGDISGNNNNATNTGTVSGVGKIGTGRNYTAATDKLDFGDIYDVDTQNGMVSIGMWVKLEGATGYLFSKGTTGQFSYEFPIVAGGEVISTQHTSTGSVYRTVLTSGGDLDDGQYHYIYVHMNQSKAEVWQDGISIGSSTSSSGTWNTDSTADFQLGARSHLSVSGFIGAQDEVSVYDFQLTVPQILEMYNGGVGFNPYTEVPTIIFDNVTMNDIVNFNNTFYNTLPIILEVNLSTIDTNNDTDVTFFLFNSTNDLINTTQFITNSLSGSLNIVLPGEGTFFFFLNASNNQTSTLSPTVGNFTVHFDETEPSLDVNLPDEYGFYDDFNFSNFITVSDVNLVSCIVTVSDETPTTCTNTSYSFTFNGNHTINVTATDSAGNTNSSLNNIMLINPIQTFNFQTALGSPIVNFSLGGLAFGDNANISTYGSVISIGSNTLLFEKLGFTSFNITFNVNLTSRINLTTNISQSTIVLRIFNRESLELLNGTTFITVEATTGFNGTTTTGLLNISDINFINEQYQILAEHVGFSPENVFFNFNNQEVINIDIYMLNATSPDAGTLTLIVKNTLSQLVESTVCSVLEWRPSISAFVSVAQGLTNVNGETIVNIELNTKIYQFSCTKETFTTVTNAQIVQLDDSTLTIILNDIFLVPTTLFPNLLTSLTNSSVNATHQLVTYTFADGDGLTTEGCLQSFFVNGNRRNFIQETCVASSTGSILTTVRINGTSDILMQGVLTTPSVIEYVTDTLTFKGNGNIAFQLAKIGLDVLLPTMFILLGLGLGVLLSNVNISMLLMALGGWLAVALVPAVMSGTISMFVTVIAGLALWGGYTRK